MAETAIHKLSTTAQFNYKIGDKVTLYFLEVQERENARSIRQIVSKQFRVYEIHKNHVTLQDRMGFKTSFPYWEFQKRLNPPQKRVNAQNNSVYMWGESIL